MEQVNSASYPRTGKRGVPQQFPRRLYNMLEAESQLPQSSPETLISWSQTGKAFRIEDVTLFSTLVLPKYFRTNKFSSFQRNLNLVRLLSFNHSHIQRRCTWFHPVADSIFRNHWEFFIAWYIIFMWYCAFINLHSSISSYIVWFLQSSPRTWYWHVCPPLFFERLFRSAFRTEEM